MEAALRTIRCRMYSPMKGSYACPMKLRMSSLTRITCAAIFLHLFFTPCLRVRRCDSTLSRVAARLNGAMPIAAATVLWRLARRRLHACVSHHNLMGPCPLPRWRRRLHALTRVTARLDRVMPTAAVSARRQFAASLAHLATCRSTTR